MHWKDAIGWLVWQAGNRLPRLRAHLAPLGLRTRQAAYRGRLADVELFDGRRVWLTHLDQNYLSYQLFWKSWRHFEPLTTALMMELLADAQVFLDIGANIGYFALTAATLHPQLRVVAFEPNPKLARILRYNVALNGLAIATEQRAISDRSGVQRFYVPASDMSGTLAPGFNDAIEQTIEVATLSLDDYLSEGIGGVQRAGQAGEMSSQMASETLSQMVIKIDTEGHESAVVRGARQLLTRTRPDLIVEVTDELDGASQDLLRRLGYRFYPITDRGLEESERLAVCRRGDLLFLNAFVSTRPVSEIAALSRRLTDRVSAAMGTVPLTDTSLYRPGE